MSADDRAVSKKRLDQFREACRRIGLKITHQRLVIYSVVADTAEHPDVETIYKHVRRRLPSVSLDTVYRTLWLLVDLGIISSLWPQRERTRFDANISAHHHFVCTKCGMIRDFYGDERRPLKIPDAVKAFGHVERTHMEFRGLCSRCSKKEESHQTGKNQNKIKKETIS
jgi:Fur family peroxide stress response transcriptional regulator